MQALNYAAMVSRFTVDTLAETMATHGPNSGKNPEKALELLCSWAPEISDETLRSPRIVLIAGEFGPAVTNTTL